MAMAREVLVEQAEATVEPGLTDRYTDGEAVHRGHAPDGIVDVGGKPAWCCLEAIRARRSVNVNGASGYTDPLGHRWCCQSHWELSRAP